MAGYSVKLQLKTNGAGHFKYFSKINTCMTIRQLKVFLASKFPEGNVTAEQISLSVGDQPLDQDERFALKDTHIPAGSVINAEKCEIPIKLHLGNPLEGYTRRLFCISASKFRGLQELPRDLIIYTRGKRSITLIKWQTTDDSSSLFSSIDLACYKCVRPNAAANLRSMIAQEITTAYYKYRHLDLRGHSPETYAQAICNPETWGGFREVEILSAMFDVQIHVLHRDPITNEVTCRSSCRAQDGCIYLLHDMQRNHYDPIYNSVEGRVAFLFLNNDMDTWNAAMKLADCVLPKSGLRKRKLSCCSNPEDGKMAQR